MALPQQVVEQLNQGSHRTPGWSSGIMLFSGSILFITLFIYAGLKFGYEPYLTGQISSLDSQAQKVGLSVSASDEATLVTFYSQISNLQSLIKNHVFFSQFLTWLEQHTEANVYYTSMVFTSGNQIALTGTAKTAADVSEQISVFEAASEISATSLSNVAFSPAGNDWTFNVVLTIDPSVLLWTPGVSSAPAIKSAVTVTPAATTSTSAVAPAISNVTTTATHP
jgi:uncharacterized protein (DUF486 family)